MGEPAKTRDRILDASRRLFNERGYSGTTLAQIAAEVGITEGNLWYHFRNKFDLVVAIEKDVRHASQIQLGMVSAGSSLTDEYAESVVVSFKHQWDHRFLLRDYRQFSKDQKPIRRDPDMAAQFDRLFDLLTRMKKEAMFRRDLPVDLKVLAHSVWIVSRYWGDHLQEQEGLAEIRWVDQERGFLQHLSVLLPYLTAPARRSLKSAVMAACSQIIDGESR